MAELKKDKVPLFYQLTNKEWVETVKDLTGAEIKVLYHVRSLDPFGDRDLDYSVTQVALLLGLSKGAVSKALKKLDQMNLICVDLVRVKVRVKTNKNSITEFPKENSVSYRKRELPIRNENFPEETQVSSGKRSFSIGNEQPPEPIQHKDASTPHTIQTYTNFKQTLSLEERESFEKFVREEYFRTEGKKIRSFTAFMSDDHFQEWYEKYQNRPEAVQVAQNAKWENHPHRDEWLNEIEKSKNPLIFAGRDKQKQEFVKWANENKIFSWFKEEEQ